jgi:hypothetical protein
MTINFDFITILSMAVGFAALGTTIYVAHNQSKLTHKIRKVSDEQQRLLSDTRNFYATAFVRTVQKISDRFEHVINLYDSTENKLQKGLILKGYYDNHLIHMLPKIEDIELVKVFGLETAEKYRIHTIKKNSKTWDVESNSGLSNLMKSYKEEMFNLIQLKDILLSFCDESVIGRDTQLEENYKLIRKAHLEG